MTPRELNKAIKALNKNILALQGKDDSQKYYDYVENIAKPEFMRLFLADQEFKYMDRTSILIMLRLNVKHRFTYFHSFGLMINEYNIQHIKK